LGCAVVVSWREMGSLLKDASAASGEGSSRVVLAVNGVRHVAAGVHPSMTLLEFLRTKTPVRGPKLGCGEGTSSIFCSFRLDRFLPGGENL
jgi:indole-3-acetaldehyde oxidase